MASLKQCLFIDDDADDQDFFCEAAQIVNPDISCTFANDGLDAMQKLSDETFIPDVIFIDLNMPKMSGHETLDEIRKIKRLNDTVIYMYSTAAAPKAVEEVRASGATDLLIKPSSMLDLQQLLQKILT